MTTPAVALVREMMGPVYGPDLVALVGDPERLRAARDHFARFVHPDLEVEMVFAAEASPHRGAEALIEAWRELLSVFSSYRSGLEEVVDAGDGVVGLFSRDTVATAEGIEMTISTGAVYEVEDGRVRRARYFPDQTAARAAIG